MTITNNGRKSFPQDGDLARYLVVETFEIALCFAIAAALVLLMVFVEILYRIVRSKPVEEKCPRSSKLMNNCGTSLAALSPRERTP